MEVEAGVDGDDVEEMMVVVMMHENDDDANDDENDDDENDNGRKNHTEACKQRRLSRADNELNIPLEDSFVSGSEV